MDVEQLGTLVHRAQSRSPGGETLLHPRLPLVELCRPYTNHTNGAGAHAAGATLDLVLQTVGCVHDRALARLVGRADTYQCCVNS